MENETPAWTSGGATCDGAALKGKGATFAAVAKYTYVKYKKCTQGPNNFVERHPKTRYHNLNVPIHRIPKVKKVLVDKDDTGETDEEKKARSRAKRARQDARTDAKRKQEGKPPKRKKKKGGKTPYILTYPAEQKGSDSRTTTMGNWKRIAAEMALRIMEGQLAKEYLPLSVWSCTWYIRKKYNHRCKNSHNFVIRHRSRPYYSANESITNRSGWSQLGTPDERAASKTLSPEVRKGHGQWVRANKYVKVNKCLNKDNFQGCNSEINKLNLEKVLQDVLEGIGKDVGTELIAGVRPSRTTEGPIIATYIPQDLWEKLGPTDGKRRSKFLMWLEAVGEGGDCCPGCVGQRQWNMDSTRVVHNRNAVSTTGEDEQMLLISPGKEWAESAAKHAMGMASPFGELKHKQSINYQIKEKVIPKFKVTSSSRTETQPRRARRLTGRAPRTTKEAATPWASPRGTTGKRKSQERKTSRTMRPGCSSRMRKRKRIEDTPASGSPTASMPRGRPPNEINEGLKDIPPPNRGGWCHMVKLSCPNVNKNPILFRNNEMTDKLNAAGKMNDAAAPSDDALAPRPLAPNNQLAEQLATNETAGTNQITRTDDHNAVVKNYDACDNADHCELAS